MLDPGDLLANPDALLTLAISGYPSGTFPAYPYRISANSGFGEPSAESSPAPGLDASVTAEASRFHRAGVRLHAAQAVIASVGSMSAVATTKTDGSSVTVHAISRANGLVVGGLITIDSVVTDLTATSQGEKTKLTGSTKISGAKIAGRAVTIDSNGVRLDKNALPIPKSLGANLNTALKRAGIEITLAAPTPSSSPGTGRLAAGGLRIDFKFSSRSVPALAALFDLLPSIPQPDPRRTVTRRPHGRAAGEQRGRPRNRPRRGVVGRHGSRRRMRPTTPLCPTSAVTSAATSAAST